MSSQTLFSFEVTESFADTTTLFAKLAGLNPSTYPRQAIKE